jgi:cytochrome c553
MIRGHVVKWLAIAAALGLVLAAGGFLFSASGIVPIKASSGHWGITAWFLKFSMRRSVATHTIGVELPPLDEPWMVLKGAGHFDLGCRPCHGAPDLRHPRISAAMTPHPPDLAASVREYDAEELFYIVKHGVKFTGMPAWPTLKRDDEVHAVVAFLLELPDLDAASYRRLVDGDRTAHAAVPPLADLSGALGVPDVVTASCAPCHGVHGRGRELPAFPKLAGQRREYLLRALDAYANGQRPSGMMGPVAAALGPGERQEIAAYYSRLPAAPATASRPHPSENATASAAGNASGGSGETPSALVASIERGERIVREGVPAHGLPSCMHCHGPSEHTRNPAYPELAGQFAEYLELQLELFQDRTRGGSEYAHLMDHVAPRLDPSWVRDVAAYYESLPP